MGKMHPVVTPWAYKSKEYPNISTYILIKYPHILYSTQNQITLIK